MAPSTRNNSALARKISTLQLRLAPLVPLPSGPPHPAFPKTLMAFHLLTEDELDSIAHYYHQSTPGPWTNHYPATMNWDKEFFAKQKPVTSPSQCQMSEKEDIWLEDLMDTLEDIQTPGPLASQRNEVIVGNPFAGLLDKARIRIKRRKVGKFIGLVGMETPVEEIAGRIEASLDRAVERSREELRHNEQVMLRRRKLA